MKNHKNILIFAVIAILILTAAFFAGGGEKDEVRSSVEPSISPTPTIVAEVLPTESEEQLPEMSGVQQSEAGTTQTPLPTPSQTEIVQKNEDKEKTVEARSAEQTHVPVQNVEPKKNEVTNEKKCSLTVRCDTILKNSDKLNPSKSSLVPSDGLIFHEDDVVFYDGESVFNVLSREMRKNKIHMEFMSTPIYNSAYIEGIANLYEFDCGELSGWMYRVNGEFPNFGSSRYILADGDKIEWLYTCDLGSDVGAENSDGFQKEE